MEEDELNMGVFGEGMEFNFNFTPPSEEDPIIDEPIADDPAKKNINTPIEDVSPEEVDEGDEQDEGSDEGSKSSSNLYSSLAAVVFEQGLLPSLDIEKDKIETVDDLVNVFKREQEIQAQVKVDEYLANIDVSKIAQSKKVIQDLSVITPDILKDNLELAKNLIYEDYINQGLDDKKATRMLKRLIDLGEEAILEDASDSLESLKEFETRKIEGEKIAYKQRIENEKAEQVELDKKLKETIYDSKELVAGFKPTKNIRDKVYKTMTEIIGKSPDGDFENKFMRERRENPLEFEARMYMFYELTNGFKDYSKLTTTAKSSAVKDLEQIARKSTIQDNGTPTWLQDSNSYDNLNGHILNI